MRIETKCIQEGYKPNNGEPRTLPIYQSTTYKYDSSEHLANLFDLSVPGHMYTRISNPTLEAVEAKIASLEGGVGAMLTSSGQSASLISLLNICQAGDHVVSCSTIYGGTFNLFNITMRKMGIDFTFINPDDNEEEIQKAFRKNTRAYFGETIANPALNILDFEKHVKIAHKNNVPIIIDNTLATPILCRPFEYGVDIIVHSTTKYMDGHAATVGGVIVDSGNFDWSSGNFPGLTTPDESYHGLIYTEAFGKAAYITKARVQLLRDLGATQSPQDAVVINTGIETLHLRMQRHCENALEIAKYLETDERVSWVNYPGLESSKYYALSSKYLPNGASGVVTFGVKGGRDSARQFMDNLKLAKLVVHVADTRTCVLHPASTTHRQLSDKQLELAGVPSDLIRLSVGIENVLDIIDDIKQALDLIR